MRGLAPPLVARSLEEVEASSARLHAPVPQVRGLAPPRRPLALQVLLDVALPAVAVLIVWEPHLRDPLSVQDPAQRVLGVGAEKALPERPDPQGVQDLRALLQATVLDSSALIYVALFGSCGIRPFAKVDQ